MQRFDIGSSVVVILCCYESWKCWCIQLGKKDTCVYLCVYVYTQCPQEEPESSDL